MSASSLVLSEAAGVRPLFGIVESLCFVLFTAAYIWRLQESHRWAWVIFPIWLLASALVHRDTPKTLGWRADNFRAATRRALPWFLGAALALLIIGVALGRFQRLPWYFVAHGRFWGYGAFCLLQQVGLNSFLTNRLLGALRKPLHTAVLSGVVFALLHWPNPVLVPLTLLAGTVMAWLFAKHRNILPLTLIQAILGTLVLWAFPMAWHHGMRVGPGFYTFHRW
jgi:hypothetical protein